MGRIEHEKLIKKAQENLKKKGGIKKLSVAKQKLLATKLPNDKKAKYPTVFGGIATAGSGGATVYGIGKELFKVKIDEKSIPRGGGDIIKEASFWDKKWVITGIAAAFFGGVTAAYHLKARSIRNQIQQALNAIPNDEISRQEFVNLTITAERTKGETIFKGIFESYNPIASALLLLTRGIAEDSIGRLGNPQNAANNYARAQGYYRAALEYTIPDGIRNRINFVYARSLILSGGDNIATGTEMGNQIPDNSPFRRLHNRRVQHLQQHNNNGFFDEEEIPFDFRGYITLQAVVDPKYCADNPPHLFEHVDISDWVGDHNSCPASMNPLDEESLQDPPQEFLIELQAWRENRLKADL